MPSLPKFLNDYLLEIRSNRLLQYGLIAVVLLGCIELALGWSDALSAKEKQLQDLRSELHSVRNQSRDEDALRHQLAGLKRAQKEIDRRLWGVSSDAVGQARLKDWLTTILKKAGSKNFNLVLSSPRAMGAREGSAEREKSSTRGDKTEAKAAAGNAVSAKDSTKSLREVRANLTLAFTPATLEQVLSDIEGGEPLATVESLNVNRRDRKVDMTVRVLMRIGQADEPLVLESSDPQATAVHRGSDSTPAAAEPENAKSPAAPVPPVAGLPIVAPKTPVADPAATISSPPAKAQPPAPANGQPVSAPPPPMIDSGKTNSPAPPPPAPGMFGGKP